MCPLFYISVTLSNFYHFVEKSSENKDPCLPDFKDKSFSLSPLSIKIIVLFFFPHLRCSLSAEEVPLYPNFISVLS